MTLEDGYDATPERCEQRRSGTDSPKRSLSLLRAGAVGGRTVLSASVERRRAGPEAVREVSDLRRERDAFVGDEAGAEGEVDEAGLEEEGRDVGEREDEAREVEDAERRRPGANRRKEGGQEGRVARAGGAVFDCEIHLYKYRTVVPVD